VSKSKPGASIRESKVRTALLKALQTGKTDVNAKVLAVAPAVTEKDLGMTIVVRTTTNKLYLYDGVKLVKTYDVATGAPQYPTPHGHFEIINKRINPAWINPALDTWGKNEPAMIPPGPDNPLGTRALDLNAPGIRIHGTPNDASIGSAASHGCIRMHIPDSEQLFGLVDVGTQVFIAY
jgi:lipoprotein-anchoring transpeptidase ErfK/SrfK